MTFSTKTRSRINSFLGQGNCFLVDSASILSIKINCVSVQMRQIWDFVASTPYQPPLVICAISVGEAGGKRETNPLTNEISEQKTLCLEDQIHAEFNTDS